MRFESHWPRRAAVGLFLVGLTAPVPALAGEGAYLDGPEELTWFVAISDTHVGAEELLYGDKDLVRLEWACTTLVATVDPAFVVNAGDLTDATSWGLIPSNQQESEWIEYAETVAGNGMDPGFYFDLPGNHDHYGDGDLTHYTTWSVAGGADGMTNHAWTFSAGETQCLALGLATCASNGKPSPSDDAGLDGVDQAFLTDTLAAHPDEALVLIFGHHPVDALGEGREVLEEVLAQDRVGLYLYGHTHDWDEFWDLGSLHVNIRSLTKSENKNVGLVAVDGGGLSVRVFDVQDWPQVLVTAPLDRDLGGGNQMAYKIPWYLEEAPVRALAFDPSGVAAVEWSLDDETWTAMEEVEEHVYQGTFDATVLSEYPQTLRVRAFGADGGEPAVHLVKILSDPDAVPPDPPDPVEPSPEVVEPGWDVEPGDVVEGGEDVGGGDAGDGDVQEGVEEIVEATEPAEDASPGADVAPAPDVGGAGEAVVEDVGSDATIHTIPEGQKGGCAASTEPAAPWFLVLVLVAALTRWRLRRRA
ncbi:MAG: metallophosphoesterase [Pseudomonadota bacterium]